MEEQESIIQPVVETVSEVKVEEKVPAGKELCPICKISYKGLKAKSCKPCAFAKIKEKTKAKRKEIKKEVEVEEVTITKPRVGETTSDNKYYL